MWWGELPQALFQGFLCHRNVCAQLGWLQLSFRNPTQCLWGRQPIIENTFDCHDRLYGKSFASFHIKKYTKWIEYIPYHGVSLVAQLVKDMPAMQETEGLDPWVGKIPWRRAWQPTLVFLPGEFPWTEEPVRLQSMRGTKSWTWLGDWAQHSTSHISRELRFESRSDTKLGTHLV